MVEPTVEHKISYWHGGILGHRRSARDGLQRRLEPSDHGHGVVRFDDVAHYLERVRAVPAVHILLEDVYRPVATGDVRCRDDSGVALAPYRAQAEHGTRSGHARAVVGELVQVPAVGTRVVGDHI